MSPSGQGASQDPLEGARLELSRLHVDADAPLRVVLEKIVSAAAEALRVERVTLWQLVDEGRGMRCRLLFHREGGKEECVWTEGCVLHFEQIPHYFAAIQQQRTIPAQKSEQTDLARELREIYLEPLGIQSMLDSPVFRRGEVAGVVCHESSSRARQWSAHERAFAAAVADAISLKLEESERLEAEARLRVHGAFVAEPARDLALEQLAAGVAHDFKNLLTVVLGHAEILHHHPALPEALKSDVEQIEAGARRGAVLAKELLQLGRPHGGTSRLVDPGIAIESFLPTLRTAVGPKHEIELVKGPLAGRVLLDPAQLERVVLNLVLNARDAMREGGRIEVRVRPDSVAAGGGRPSQYVAIDVEDSGVGMDTATIAHVFEPYFTGRSGGTGLGLSVVRQLVHHWGGFARVESAPGEGTTISLLIPRAK